jgi:hypothetical protein
MRFGHQEGRFDDPDEPDRDRGPDTKPDRGVEVGVEAGVEVEVDVDVAPVE